MVSRHRFCAAVPAAILLLAAAHVSAAPPTRINYQGQLKVGGSLFAGPAASMKFAIVAGTTSLWSNDGTSVGGSQPTGSVSVPVSNGIFVVQLGGPPMTPLTADVFSGGSSPALRVWVNTGGGFEQLSPDDTLSSVPFALQSEWTTSGTSIYRLSGNVGIGTATPAGAFDVIGSIVLRSNAAIYRDPVLNGIVFNTPDVTGHTRMFVADNGRVGIGTTNPGTTLDVVGDVSVVGTVSAKIIEITGADLAEPFSVLPGETPEPGTLLVIDADHAGALTISDRGYDARVAGVVSGAGGINPGIKMYSAGDHAGAVDVALSGRVYTRATTANGPILPGDLLTTSDVPGHAMKATDSKRARGAIIGKAMSALSKGEGLVLVLVQPQ